MRHEMVVTDLTQMQGDRVCVGGYLEDGTSVRPVCHPYGPTKSWLQPHGGAQVVPFSVVDLELGASPAVTPPHTEDRTVPVSGHRVLEILSEADQADLLEWSASPTVRKIFGADVRSAPDQQWGRFVQYGEGARSLGTVVARRVIDVNYSRFDTSSPWRYRLRFADASGDEFQLAVVALDFRHRLDAMRDSGFPAERIGPSILTLLRNQTVYLRIGLARGWQKYPDRCYLQITGVYGFDAIRLRRVGSPTRPAPRRWPR
jgi:hypothetical protein